MIHTPPAHILRLVNESVSHIPHTFSKLLLLCSISVGLFVVLSLKGCTLFPLILLALPEPNLLSFKVLGVKSC